jgi:hypothetical protein
VAALEGFVEGGVSTRGAAGTFALALAVEASNGSVYTRRPLFSALHCHSPLTLAQVVPSAQHSSPAVPHSAKSPVDEPVLHVMQDGVAVDPTFQVSGSCATVFLAVGQHHAGSTVPPKPVGQAARTVNRQEEESTSSSTHRVDAWRGGGMTPRMDRKCADDASRQSELERMRRRARWRSATQCEGARGARSRQAANEGEMRWHC